MRLTGYDLFVLEFFCLQDTCMAKMPLGLITYKDDPSSSYYCAPSSWGKTFPKEARHDQAAGLVVVFDKNDPYGCDENEKTNISFYNTIRLVNRGHCTFLKKTTLAKNNQAMGVLVRNTLQAVYELDILSKTIKIGHYPYAYNCENGQAYVPTLDEQPWKTTAVECTSNTKCVSSLCLPTSVFEIENGGHQLCCIWDSFTILKANKTEAKVLGVNALYVGMVTITIGKELESNLDISQDGVSLSLRYRPVLDPSEFFLWLLAVGTVMLGSTLNVRKTAKGGTPSSKHTDVVRSDAPGFTSSMLTQVIIIILSTCITLLLMYFFPLDVIASVVLVLHFIFSMSYLLFTPMMVYLQKHVPFLKAARAETTGIVCGIIVSGVWIFFRKEMKLVWMLQDVLGVCSCILFLGMNRIPTLRIGTIVPTLAFSLLVFVVFLTPSVLNGLTALSKVPTSKADYPGRDYCERYPYDDRCNFPLPMVVVMPIMVDFIGGFTVLSYGTDNIHWN